jgi:hypothetical protein
MTHEAIWESINEKGIPVKLINIIKELHRESNCGISHRGKFNDPIPIRNGVRQACVLSPLLFNIVLDSVLCKATDTTRGIRINLTSRLEDLDHADDMCLLSHTLSDMKHKLRRLEDEAKIVGLKINIAKTKEMRIMAANSNNLYPNDNLIERVNQFTYLESIVVVQKLT